MKPSRRGFFGIMAGALAGTAVAAPVAAKVGSAIVGRDVMCSHVLSVYDPFRQIYSCLCGEFSETDEARHNRVTLTGPITRVDDRTYGIDLSEYILDAKLTIDTGPFERGMEEAMLHLHLKKVGPITLTGYWDDVGYVAPSPER